MQNNKKDFKKAQSEYEYELNNPFDNDNDNEQKFGVPDYYKQYTEDRE